jgi:hypothetical protein
MSDRNGAALMLLSLPPAKELLSDNGQNSNHFRQASSKRGIAPFIPSRRNRKMAIS